MFYRKYQEIKGIAHTHSVNVVAFAQAGMAIPAFGKSMRIISMEIFHVLVK